MPSDRHSQELCAASNNLRHNGSLLQGEFQAPSAVPDFQKKR
jgi:hypothetical protein